MISYWGMKHSCSTSSSTSCSTRWRTRRSLPPTTCTTYHIASLLPKGLYKGKASPCAERRCETTTLFILLLATRRAPSDDPSLVRYARRSNRHSRKGAKKAEAGSTHGRNTPCSPRSPTAFLRQPEGAALCALLRIRPFTSRHGKTTSIAEQKIMYSLIKLAVVIINHRFRFTV